jgi:lipid A 3-O-deacylase
VRLLALAILGALGALFLASPSFAQQGSWVNNPAPVPVQAQAPADGKTTAPAPAAAKSMAGSEDPMFLTIGGGLYDLNRPAHYAAEFNVGWRSDTRWWIFKQHAGALFTDAGTAYGYWGLLIDLYIGNRIVFTPSTAVGLWRRGGGPDLGHIIEFRSGGELAYRFDNRSRLGVGFYHISNTGFWADKNPGEETIMLNYSVPTNLIFGDSNKSGEKTSFKKSR